MTREEIIKHLHEALDFVDIHFPYRYVFVEAIEALSQPSLSALGEAAEEYSLDVKAKPYGNLVKEAFKSGATWRDAQIPSLPSNLDEAAEEWCKTNNKGIALSADKKSHYLTEGKESFKAGAEWMAGQGISAKSKVCKLAERAWVTPIDEKQLQRDLYDNFIAGDKVIVQIRKK